MGQTAQIERAFLDGSDRRVLHNTDLSQPVGITVDYSDWRIYWSDVGLNRIEFCNIDGTGRTIVETEAAGLYHPFALTVADSTLFWTDWETNSVYATHKDHGSDETLGHFTTIASFPSTPYGIEAILESRQPPGVPHLKNSVCPYLSSPTSLQLIIPVRQLTVAISVSLLDSVSKDSRVPVLKATYLKQMGSCAEVYTISFECSKKSLFDPFSN